MISLGEEHIKEIERHGERIYSHECGGMFIGGFNAADGKTGIEFLPMENDRTKFNEEEIRKKF